MKRVTKAVFGSGRPSLQAMSSIFQFRNESERRVLNLSN